MQGEMTGILHISPYRRSGNFRVKNNSQNFFNGRRLQYGRASGEFLAFSLLPGIRRARDHWL